jgi:hypothetical protein
MVIAPELIDSSFDAKVLLRNCSRRMTTPEIQSCLRIANGKATPDDLIGMATLRAMFAADLKAANPPRKRPPENKIPAPVVSPANP